MVPLSSCIFFFLDKTRIRYETLSLRQTVSQCVSENLRRQLCLGHLFLYKTSYRCDFFQVSSSLLMTLDVMNTERNCYAKLRHVKRQLSINELARRRSLFYSADAKFLGRLFFSVYFKDGSLIRFAWMIRRHIIGRFLQHVFSGILQYIMYVTCITMSGLINK